MKILILKPSSLGDIIHAIPTVHHIRRAHPRAQISWLINDTFAPILNGLAFVDDIIEFPRADFGKLRNLPRFRKFCRQLRERRFDIVLDLQGLLRSGFLARATRAPRRIGLSDAREGARHFYTEIIPVPKTSMHAVDRYLLALNALQIPRGTIEFPLPDSSETSSWADQFLSNLQSALSPRSSPFIILNPCARWLTKRWPPKNFAALITQLAQKIPGVNFVLIGSASDAPIAGQILSALTVQRFNVSTIANAVGETSLPQLVELLRRADLVITNDSGPMHIAAALGKPLVALFGPTDPVKVGPYSAHLKDAPFTVLRACAAEAASSPQRRPNGPIEKITVEKVASAVYKRL